VNLAGIVDAHPDDAVALVSRGETTTYGELRRQVAELRGGLVRLGVGPGDRIAIVAGGNWAFVVVYLAALGVGAIAVPLNPESPGAELERELATIGASTAIVGAAGARGMRDVDGGAVGLRRVLVPEGVDLPGASSLSDAFGGEPAPMVERSEDDLAALVFTAGTGGSPRAAMLTHGNLLANLHQVQAHPGRAVRADDVILGVLPLFHIFGLNVSLGLALLAGASIVLAERFDPTAALEAIATHRVTLLAGAPTMFAMLAAVPGAEAGQLASVRMAVSGAAPLAVEVVEAFEARFGRRLWQGYGLTEAGPVVTSSIVDQAGERPGDRRLTSIGVPLPGVEVRLVDEEGEETLAGDPGEVWVRGPNVFRGYWNDPAATEAVLTSDGWLRTGDVAVADDDGYLYLVDRRKDLIIVSGFNVYPAEVEEVLLAHPGIAEAAVVGTPHPHSGEAVRAFVVPQPGQLLEEDEIIAWCRAHLARYKAPTKVDVVPSLPHGLGGKLLRWELR